MNIVVHMSTDPNTAHQGIFMENGRSISVFHLSITLILTLCVISSGGFLGDLVFNGGKDDFNITFVS